MSKFFGIFHSTEKHEVDFMEEAGCHTFVVSFAGPEIEDELDEHTGDIIKAWGVPDNIVNNEEMENTFSILKSDYADEDQVKTTLEALGIKFDPNFFGK